jgi:hypothetical protein
MPQMPQRRSEHDSNVDEVLTPKIGLGNAHHFERQKATASDPHDSDAVLSCSSFASHLQSTQKG